MKDPIAIYNEINRFGSANGMELEVIEPGHIQYLMTIQDQHLASPVAAHGGALAGMMDGILGVAALSWSITEKKLVSTVEFKINYFHPAKPGEKLMGIGKLDHRGKRLIHATGEIYSLDREKLLIAKGIGTFNAYPWEKSEAASLFMGDL